MAGKKKKGKKAYSLKKGKKKKAYPISNLIFYYLSAAKVDSLTPFSFCLGLSSSSMVLTM